MSFSDIRIVAILVLFVGLYAFFNFLYASSEQNQDTFVGNSTNTYNTPASSGFWTTINNIAQFNTKTPEIAFLNTTIFLTFSAIVVFLGLRFFRGTG